jgi:hypothetical protein
VGGIPERVHEGGDVTIQWGIPPPKTLSHDDREAIKALLKGAKLLPNCGDDLDAFFSAIDSIITAQSPQAQPLVDPERLQRVRDDFSDLRTRASELQAALGGVLMHGNEQTKTRLMLGLMTLEPGKLSLRDFPTQLGQFRDLVDTIHRALEPKRGGGDRTDHLRTITQLCAVQYRSHLGKDPARRPGGVFHRLMTVVLKAIDLKLPKKPYSILKPAIDAAVKSPQQTPSP